MTIFTFYMKTPWHPESNKTSALSGSSLRKDVSQFKPSPAFVASVCVEGSTRYTTYTMGRLVRSLKGDGEV